MDKGNEGDEIIIFALLQIGCKFNETIKSMGEFDANTLISVVVKSLNIINKDAEESKISDDIPVNIASRHRYCTNIANKVKELGYRGDCSYNQLLYPVANQTKPLLTWLVQRLPRLEEDVTPDVVGANVLLSRRIASSLNQWKKRVFTLNKCAKGRPLVNIYFVERKLVEMTDSYIEVKEIFNTHLLKNKAPEPTILEVHSFDLIFDQEFSGFESMSSDDSYSEKLMKLKRKYRLSEVSKSAIRSAISVARKDTSLASTTFTDTNASNDSRLSSGLSSDFLNGTLSDVINFIVNKSNDHASSDELSTRFIKASEFSQESSNVIDILETSSKAAENGAVDTVTDVMSAKDRFEKEKVQREKNVNDLRERLDAETSEVENFESRLSNIASKIRQVENELTVNLSTSEALENEIIIKKKTLEMLPSALENIGKLQSVCATGASRLLQLSQQWEDHRKPLIFKYRQMRNKRSKRRNLCKQMIDDIKQYKLDMSAMVQDLKLKQEKSVILSEELNKLPKNINRTVYTHRILDIIASIGKQVKEITKITADILNIQKSINMGLSSLQRADAVTEDLIYTAANGPSRDDAMVSAYRQLRSLRSNFDELISTIDKTGSYEKQSRLLETKIDQETSRVSTNNFKRLQADINEVQDQNAKIVAEIKSIKM